MIACMFAYHFHVYWCVEYTSGHQLLCDIISWSFKHMYALHSGALALHTAGVPLFPASVGGPGGNDKPIFHREEIMLTTTVHLNMRPLRELLPPHRLSLSICPLAARRSCRWTPVCLPEPRRPVALLLSRRRATKDSVRDWQFRTWKRNVIWQSEAWFIERYSNEFK